MRVRVRSNNAPSGPPIASGSKRYPERLGRRSLRAGDRTPDVGPATVAEPQLQKLPPEIGVLLIVLGTAGVLIPGPVGATFLVAGGLVLWPSGFRQVEQ